MNAAARFAAGLAEVPVIAILRGIRPEEAGPVGDALYAAGIRIVEVPLNSPEPLASIRALVARLDSECLVGAGTVLLASDVAAVVEAGGGLIVSPNTDVDVIAATRAAGVVAVPGVATPTEALQACAAGARYLKVFPAATFGPSHIGALQAVLPGDARLIAVGGIVAGNIADWLSAGACGVGIGSEIYRPGDSPDEAGRKASAIVNEIQQASRKK